MRIYRSFLFFYALLFANSHLHAQIKIDLTKNVSDTVGKKEDSTAFKKDSIKLNGFVGANNADLRNDTNVYAFTNVHSFPTRRSSDHRKSVV